MTDVIFGMLDREDNEVRVYQAKETRDQQHDAARRGAIVGDWVKIQLTYEIEKEPLPTAPGSVIETPAHGFLVFNGARWGNSDYDIWTDEAGSLADYTIIFDAKKVQL